MARLDPAMILSECRSRPVNHAETRNGTGRSAPEEELAASYGLGGKLVSVDATRGSRTYDASPPDNEGARAAEKARCKRVRLPNSQLPQIASAEIQILRTLVPGHI